MLSPSALTKVAPSLRLATRQMSVISGPPRVKISPVEKAAHGIAISVAMLLVPGWVLANIKNYKAHD